jgi:hypothetical protein
MNLKSFGQANYIAVPDFTEAAYRQMLERALQKFRFVTFDQVVVLENLVLLRHDIDFSIADALRVAQIEAELGIKSTFFVDFHSPFYHPMEKGETEKLRQILRLGHQIGVHFDASFFDIKSEFELNSALGRESNLVETLTGFKPTAFSFHNPTEEHLAFRSDCYAGLVNCYSDTLSQQFKYCSDSNGHWRFQSAHEVLQDPMTTRVQLLIHAEHWRRDFQRTRERIHAIVYGRATDAMASYDQLLKLNDRQNLSKMPQSLWQLRSSCRALFEQVDFLFNQDRYDLVLSALLTNLKSRTSSAGDAIKPNATIQSAFGILAEIQQGVNLPQDHVIDVIEQMAAEVLTLESKISAE